MRGTNHKHERAFIRVAVEMDTAGLGAASYLAAIDAGVDCVEVSIVPFANGTSQPDTQRMLALLEGHPRCPKFDTEKLAKLRDYFEGVYKELSKFTSPANERVDSDILVFQVPGGMLSNFRTQLAEQGMADKFDDVVREIPVVREALLATGGDREPEQARELGGGLGVAEVG